MEEEKKNCTKLTKEIKRLNFIANNQFKIHKTRPMFTIMNYDINYASKIHSPPNQS